MEKRQRELLLMCRHPDKDMMGRELVATARLFGWPGLAVPKDPGSCTAAPYRGQEPESEHLK